MKTSFLHKNQNSKELVLFFSGFASNPTHFRHLGSSKNVLMVYDYEDLNLSLDLNTFEKITLIAFSMGVCVANSFLKNAYFYSKITQKIAINGTNLGIDKHLGIHPSIFVKTMKNFSLQTFKEALFKEYLRFTKDFVFKDENALKKELSSLWEFANKNKENFLLWDKVFASENDAIFPNSALKNSFARLYWLNEPHFAFFHFNTWDLF